MGQKKSIAVNAVARVVMYTLNLLISMLVGPYLARVLDVNLYAEYNAGTSILQWFLPFAMFGSYIYGVRQASQVCDFLQITNRIFSQLFIIGIISSTIVLLVYIGFIIVAKSNCILLYLLLGIQLIANYFAIEWLNEALENYTFFLCKTALVRLAYIASIFIFIKKPDDVLPFAAIASLVILLNNILGYFYIKQKFLLFACTVPAAR